MAGIFGLRPEDDPFLMDKLNRHRPLHLNVVDEPTDPRVEPPENQFFKRPELIPRPPAGAATEPLVKPIQPFEVAADPAITRNPSPGMPKVLPPPQEAAPTPDVLAPPKAPTSLMDRPAQAPVPVRPTAEYQAPHLSKGRTIGGILASMFRPTAGLGDYLLNDPYRRAETDYSNQLKKQSDFDTTIKQGYEARADQRAQAGDVRAEQAAQDVHQKAIRPPGSPQTITTDKGIMGWNDATGNYDRPQGNAPAKQDTSESEFEAWKKQHPGAPVENFMKLKRSIINVPKEGEEGKLLSPDEAAKLNVPYGTTRGQAKGKIPQSTKPPNESENKALGFYERAKQANDVFGSSEKEIAKLGLGGQMRLENAPNWAQSEAGKSYLAGARMWIKSVLRLDSGAAIPPNEEKQFMKTYFVQPGDNDQVQAQKAAGRKAAEDSLKIQANRAYKAKYGEEESAPAASGGGVQVGQQVKLKDGTTITVKKIHPDGSFE